MSKQVRKIPVIVILVYFFYVIHLNLENEKSIKARKINRKWKTTKEEKSLPSGGVLYREAATICFQPSPSSSE